MPRIVTDELRENALHYHRSPKPGKLEIKATKPLSNQRDLALAYTPGVASACMEIHDKPEEAFNLTAKGNMVAVITNGTAVLGLGNIGPLASKPVMEGKAVLFKKFADIDVFDLELNANDPENFINVVAALEPTFGGINLEDIKAPECFVIEDELKSRMNIPVFHDDQHGTAIIVAAAIVNGMEIAGKKLSDIKIVTSGAGAAALACLNLLVGMGAKPENIWISDIDGVAYVGRDGVNQWMAPYAKQTEARTLGDIIEGADVFLGLSAGGVLKADMVKRMGEKPLIMALANPNPEIHPEEARMARPDAMICTGRSDFPNQVNNVLCFPYIFRGALDCGATAINEEMKIAATLAIAALAHEPTSETAAQAYEGGVSSFGPESLIPNPFDQRLILRIAPAVAKAAMETGVAARPIEDFEAYNERLTRFVFRSGLIMRPVFAAARKNLKRIIYAEGEDERVLRAASMAIADGWATPILIGRPDVIERRAAEFGLSIKAGQDVEVINPNSDPRYHDYINTLVEVAGRKGVPLNAARTLVRTNSTVIACLAIKRGDADAMICGLEGRFYSHLDHIRRIIGLGPRTQDFATISGCILDRGTYFFADTYGNVSRSVEHMAQLTRRAAGIVKRFGITPKVALLANSSFGSAESDSIQLMRDTATLLHEQGTDFEFDGEMHGNTALNQELRQRLFPGSTLKGEANVFIFPSSDAANLAYQLVMELGSGTPIGPILVGAAATAHVLVPAATTRSVVNVSAVAAVEVQARIDYANALSGGRG
ncbi:MAG: NADP-dependent malic enzyme [Anderseniella sp.]|jgi:malate dehydrogenase (oxaloacetate-decarboxylating)(NADP+)|nr:NADP-dependent malic enzyme [Anderseniella sp.]